MKDEGRKMKKTQKVFLLVAGARPNFMKVAPIARVFRKRGIPFRLLNTGQHHDPALSDVFLKQLKLGQPHFNLGVGSGTHAETTARVLERGEQVLLKLKPRAVIVVGDVNSTMAMALAASKLHFPVAHVEAGLRSRDPSMPEEVNRILTDRISDLLLTPSADADANLKTEGVSAKKIARVGNVMIDSLVAALRFTPRPMKECFALMTFHRPSNVDSREGLKKLAAFLEKNAAQIPVILPLHPRTKARLQQFKLWKRLMQVDGLKLTAPMAYFDFVHHMRSAKVVVTDSGGIQEETTHLGVPCLIMRTTTERPICVERGTAELMGEDYGKALRRLRVILDGKWKKPRPIPLWDGHTAERIVSALVKKF